MRHTHILTRADVRAERPEPGAYRLSWLHDKKHGGTFGYVMLLGGCWRGYVNTPNPFSVSVDTRTAAILNTIELHNTLERARAYRREVENVPTVAELRGRAS